MAGWIGIIVFAVVPIGRYRERATWQRVAWIPFVSQPVTLLDVTKNVLLYVPFGYLDGSAMLAGSAMRMLAHAVPLSVTTEAAQVYSRGRYPSATDVVCNGIGALLGFAASRRRATHRVDDVCRRRG